MYISILIYKYNKSLGTGFCVQHNHLGKMGAERRAHLVLWLITIRIYYRKNDRLHRAMHSESIRLGILFYNPRYIILFTTFILFCVFYQACINFLRLRGGGALSNVQNIKKIVLIHFILKIIECQREVFIVTLSLC